MASLLRARCLALTAAAALACSGRPAAPPPAPRPPPATADASRPLPALRLGADEAAARLGAFAWQGALSWTVVRTGAATLRVAEKHRLRQLPGGDFEVSSEIDPGDGPGSITGLQVLYVGGMAYGRGRWAPFRERPTDRGQDARRYRDQSFELAGELSDLYGPALAATAAGQVEVLGRPALRYRLSLSGEAPRPAAPPEGLPAAGYDADTRRHVDFLEKRLPTALEGELLVDARTGVPLSITLRGAFTEVGDAQLRADVELAAQVTALGDEVPAVAPPKGALPDERKPKGVARALEAAGLRKAPGAEAGEGERDEDEPGQ